MPIAFGNVNDNLFCLHRHNRRAVVMLIITRVIVIFPWFRPVQPDASVAKLLNELVMRFLRALDRARCQKASTLRNTITCSGRPKFRSHQTFESHRRNIAFVDTDEPRLR